MKVAHVKDKTFTVYIGRPSIFGNPYIVGQHGDRGECIKQFARYAKRSPRILAAIKALPKDAVLGCHCHPKACHGDAIVRLWQSLHSPRKP